MSQKLGIFTFTMRGTFVRLPQEWHEEFKTKLLLGVKEYEYIIPHAYFDELNDSYPYVTAKVIPSSTKMESLIPGFRTVTFTTE